MFWGLDGAQMGLRRECSLLCPIILRPLQTMLKAQHLQCTAMMLPQR